MIIIWVIILFFYLSYIVHILCAGDKSCGAFFLRHTVEEPLINQAMILSHDFVKMQKRHNRTLKQECGSAYYVSYSYGTHITSVTVSIVVHTSSEITLDRSLYLN